MPEKGDPGFTLISFLLLIALGMFAWKPAPLTSARPQGDKEDGQERGFDDEIQARLWQDPFRALRVVRRRGAGETQTPPRKVTPLPEAIEREVLGSDDVPGATLTVLVALLSPGPYAEVEETRRRRRYAILSALSDSGYAPRDAENLRVFPFSFVPEPRCGPSADKAAATDKVDVPYEWYDLEDRARQEPPVDGSEPCREGSAQGARHEATRAAAVVLWLDESSLGEAPFCRLALLVDAALCEVPKASRAKIRWVVLGPSRSGTLNSLIKDKADASRLRASGLGAFHILSPTATVSDCALDGKLSQCPKCDAERDAECDAAPVAKPPPAAPSALLGDAFTESCEEGTGHPCMRFLRTIRSDDDLIEELGHELALRGVEAGDTVAVLSEWDTYFGRSLPAALEKALQWKGGGPKVVRYTYARGIDGIVAPQAAVQGSPDAPTKGATERVEHTAIRRPLGTAQFDYLRRLAHDIRARDHELRIERGHGHGVRAVAVLGSDVYDKLLVLQGLRDKLPGAIWLTTDLDANLLHPDELQWTRNLVVASSYELAPPTGLDARSPPFRDSYQTSAYVAARLAVGGAGARALWCTDEFQSEGEPFPGQQAFYDALPPILFEVGRDGAVQLREPTRTPGPSAQRTSPTTARDERDVAPDILGSAMLALVGLLVLPSLRPRAGAMVLAALALLLVLAGVVAVALLTVRGGEPIELTAGVSIWPTVLIRIVALYATCVFVYTALRSLRANWQDLDQRYFGGPSPERVEGLSVAHAGARTAEGSSGRAWMIGTAALLAALVGIMFVLRLLRLPIQKQLVVQAGCFLAVGAIWAAFVHGRFPPRVQMLSIHRWLGEAPEDDAAALWRRYADYGTPEQRFLRSATKTLLYFFAGSIVFTLLGGSEAPCRGPVACRLDGITLGVSVIAMLFLLFLVVDAIQLCILWITKIRDPRLWSPGEAARLARRLHLPESQAPCWLIVHLIGQRTREVGRLIYYPLIVFLLMLIARSTYFDYWDFPLALALIVGINFAIALLAATALNLFARHARDTVLDHLRTERMELDAATPAPAPDPNQIETLIDKLGGLKEGAYRPFWDQPVARALLFLLSGLALTFSEYLRGLT